MTSSTIEIERKFRVKGDFRSFATRSCRIRQGYLCSRPEATVRLRLAGEKAWLTIKGATDEKGLSRYEFEQEIPSAEGEKIFALCEAGGIEKERFWVPHEGHTWEVDVFHGDNQGLVIAELELSAEDEPFVRPEWLGDEVTGDKRYYNALLAQTPYTHPAFGASPNRNCPSG